MDLKEFDDILKNKLEELPATHTTPDWDRMNRQLDEDSLKDQMFDEQVSRKLEQLSIHQFARPSWNSLYQLIDRRFQNKRKVAFAKSFELLAILLLLITFNNLGIFNGSTVISNADANDTESPLIASNLEFQDEQLASAGILNQDITADLEASSTLENILSINSDVIVQNGNSSAESFTKKSSGINSSLVRDIDVSAEFQNTYQSALVVNSRTPFPFSQPLAGLELGALNNEISSTSLEVKHSNDISATILKEVYPKDFSEELLASALTEEIYSIAEVAVPSVSLVGRKKSKWFVSAELGNNFHEVLSSVHQSVSMNRSPNVTGNLSSIRTTASQTGSLKFGYKLGSAEISSGFGFERVKYNPGLILQTGQLTSKIKETTINDIQYDFLNVPLEINWNVLKVRSWSLQAHTGLVANVLLRAKESISQIVYSGSRITVISPENIDNSVFNFEFQRGYFDDEVAEVNKSVLNVMNLKTKLGFSINKMINPRTAIFGRSDYIYQLPSSILSPGNENIDRINTLSFTMGIKQFLG